MNRIYARNTTIQTISSETADEFIKKYHNQGLVAQRKNRYDIGIFHKGEMLGVASFGNTKTAAMRRKYQQELVRMAFKSGTQVIGGASKLIKYYINDFKPRNFFTYQTTSGVMSDVYEKSGMTLRNNARDKRVLVKNGHTYESALEKFRTEGITNLFLNAERVGFGPDRLLGTKIGVEYHENGKRKTNEELFIEYCDYHSEMIPGDRIYDYNNENYVHYIYRITSTDPQDKFYYLGRHSEYVLKGDDFDPMLDGYMGSGGKDFQDWRQGVYDSGWDIQKEILSTQTRWSDNVKAEADIVGEHLMDEFCLNMEPGGVSAHVANKIIFTEQVCDIHGLTLFRNNTCGRCSYNKAIRTGTCPTHGETLFREDSCLRCTSLKAIRIDQCDKHGYVTFNGSQCMLCQNEALNNVQTCDLHGETIFRGDTCAKCTANKGLEMKMCEIHGESKHRSGECLACTIQSHAGVDMKVCDIHGLTKHRGDSCFECASAKRYTIQTCPIHGDVKFSGDKCVTCTTQNTFQDAECEIHGLTSFQGGKCRKCIDSASRSVKMCKKHGMVNHQGDVCLTCKNQASVKAQWCEECGKETRFNGKTCMSCVNRRMIQEKECPIHGLTTHRSKTCLKCASEKRAKKPKKVPTSTRKHCDVCNKEARHVNDKCMSCAEQALYNTAVCEIHGETRFRAKKCCKCRSEEMKARRAAKKNEITK